MVIHKEGKTKVVFKDFTVPPKQPHITANQLEKLCRSEIIGYVIQVNTMQSVPQQQDTNDHPVAISDLLMEFQDVFTPKIGLPPPRECDHDIPLVKGSKPPNIRPYRISHKQKEEVEKLIKEMLQDSTIRPSHNPYASSAILVRKKDGSWRMCIDYRELNSHTIKNKFPIPIIEDLLDELFGEKVFTKLDLKSGYHQIRMKEVDVHKTTFRTYLGHYEFLVMPFGLSNAPTTFRTFMNKIFAPHLRKFVLVFFDDILVFNQSLEDHVLHLKQVLQILRDNELTAKKSKCVFAVPQVEYLGHVIGAQGVSTVPNKVETIKNWPTPKIVTQLRSFLGLTCYYRRFVQYYRTMCRSLHDLLKKDPFHWDSTHTAAF
jgi:hypothetical protein